MKFYRFLLVLLILWNCETEEKRIILRPESYNNNYTANINVLVHKAKGNDEQSELINEQIEKLISQSINPDASVMSIQENIDAFNLEYENFLTDFPDASTPWELHIESEISYQSESILSIAINIYRYEGGAHGNDKIVFLNLNPKTVEAYTFNEFVKDKEAFKTKAKAFFIKHLEVKNASSNLNDYFYGANFKLPEEIGFCEEGVILLYNVYEIASYSRGYTEFVIPFEQIENILNVY